MPQDLRTYLDDLAGDSSDELYQVSAEVDPNLELTGGIAKPEEQKPYPDRSHHGYFALRKWHDRGQPMPAVMVIGHHPMVMMASVSKLAGIGGELEVAGGLLGEDLRVVRGATVDLPVPADAEIVVEGH